MNSPLISPASPDGELLNEKDPALRANEKRGHECESILPDVSLVHTESQPSEIDLNLVDFAASAPEPLDPLDLTSFALNEEFHSGVSKKVITTVQVGKPGKESFVRTKLEPADCKLYPLIELKEEGKIYILSPQLAATLSAEGESTLVTARLLPTVDRRGNFFLWVLKTSARESNWHTSAFRAATLAAKMWIRVQSNVPAGVYDTHIAIDQNAEPQWPEEDFATILKIAFQGRVITTADHPVIQELKGNF